MFILITSLFTNFNSVYQFQGSIYQKTLFSLKDLRISILGFIRNMVSVVTSQV